MMMDDGPYKSLTPMTFHLTLAYLDTCTLIKMMKLEITITSSQSLKEVLDDTAGQHLCPWR